MSQPVSPLFLALELLQGYFTENRNGVFEHRFVTNALEEKAARRALAELLRNNGPLDRRLRNGLAALIDMDASGYPGDERMLVFRDRKKSRKHNLRNTQIFNFIKSQKQSGTKIGPAIEAAAQKFGRGEEAIKKIWEKRLRLDALPIENAKVTFYTRIVREG
jgi:hypothetical protein